MKALVFTALALAWFGGCAEGESLNDATGGSGGRAGAGGGTGGAGGHVVDAAVDAPPDATPCPQDAATHSCASATDLGAIALGASVSQTSNLPMMGTEDWYAVTFASNTSTSYHPHVFFSSNPNGVTKIDVLSNCGTALACMGGQTTNITEWETRYTGGDPNSPGFAPIPAVGAAGRVLIRVYRAATGPSCETYTLTVAN